jgi:hypothetical protein
MSASLNKRRREIKPIRFHVSSHVIDQRKQQEQFQPYRLSPVTDDEEMKFVARAVVWMIAFSVIPMILFHIINYFYPEIFLLQIALE